MKNILKKTKKAFTLIEMVIVLFIISLLLLIMIPNLGNQKAEAMKKSNEAFRISMQTQVDMYDESTPVTWDVLVDKKLITKKQAEQATKKYGEIPLDKQLKDKNATSEK
ncbi:competence type IV pilus major pilin ComGC [Companilactobacillus hulinensis]|uniref:competence type IV pilus major pilin ComGC n=1 Tax=Companilactobacillus hulinensis TaxID=2486007 RepID=UPI000F771F79|nr:competence type IV pilus major pilin ComGC [Companilactobacillus hulinensis]